LATNSKPFSTAGSAGADEVAFVEVLALSDVAELPALLELLPQLTIKPAAKNVINTFFIICYSIKVGLK
jgi:hypothetical protein